MVAAGRDAPGGRPRGRARIRATNGRRLSILLTTDGPFAESKEHLAGFYLIQADDLDGALSWASKVTSVVGAPIEVRPLWDGSGA